MAQRRIPRFPLEIVMDDQRVSVMTPAAIGMLMRLLWHFWKRECEPLPKADMTLTAIAWAHRPSWAAHKREILAILGDLSPALIRQRKAHALKIESLMRNSIKGREVLRARRLEKRRQDDLERAAPLHVIPSRTQTQHRINVENRTKRHDTNVFVDRF